MELPVAVEQFGIKKKYPNVVLICQHDGNQVRLLNKYPEIAEPYQEDPQTFDDYFELERDIGSTVIARKIATTLLEITTNISILLIRVLDSRGIIDSNRTVLPGKEHINPNGVHTESVREIFDHQKHDKIYRELSELQRKIVAKIMALLNSLSGKGVFVDIHTMNDHDPKKSVPPVAVSPSIEGVRKYIDHLTLPEFQGRKRSLNILTSFINEPPRANMDLVKRMESRFDRGGIRTERDVPYSLVGFSTCSLMADTLPNKGTILDIPINEISESDRAHNIHPKLDLYKIGKIARIIAFSVQKTLLAQL